MEQLVPRDRAMEHIKVTVYPSSLLARLVLYRALEMLDLRQLNEIVAWSNEAERQIDIGAHGIYHQAVLRRGRER